MSRILERITRMAEEMNEPIGGVPFPEQIVLEPGAVVSAAVYLEEGGYRRILLVADSHTFEEAGKLLSDRLSSRGLTANLTLVKPNPLGDVVADEASVIQVLLDIQRTQADIVVVAGAGTLHDIARYAAFTSGLPFVSVPAAPSVDGFTSRGAPLLIRGDKITVQASGPIAIFADTDILRKAPVRMVAAGFGDMLGKSTSLFDWKFGRLSAGEPYSPLVARITEEALQACIDNAAAIGRASEEGITKLTAALIESGLAMLIFGQSHPASGAEHHLSHYWEMDFIRTGKRQLLHGAKVGVACTVVAALYRRIADEGLIEWNGAGRDEVGSLLREIPDEAMLKELLAKVRGPSTLEELGIDSELAARGLKEAHRVRPNRGTLLRYYNERIG
ncbi:sn-glycerol-1-phosphate dehydrogenase [Paenibacillus alkalitolerans]|uniref:sn-glycerol-1-phosphate dehydrogenase n=1 Tax=Paenibacillus alkalitolerans TaxID=2799335 RepID=UPI002D7F1A3F|nr:sn-glycerol-1-phosphate dehydrogenase [Paenibacillus alkalitolerans]